MIMVFFHPQRPFSCHEMVNIEHCYHCALSTLDYHEHEEELPNHRRGKETYRYVQDQNETRRNKKGYSIFFPYVHQIPVTQRQKCCPGYNGQNIILPIRGFYLQVVL